MTSCFGTSRTIVRRSTRTIFWMTGQTRMSPGPFTPSKRPRKKITPRSYSRNTLMALLSTMITRTAMTPQKIGTLDIRFLPLFLGGDVERQPVHAVNTEALSASHGYAADRIPLLAINPHLAGSVEIANGFGRVADQLFRAGHDRPAPCAHCQPDHGEHGDTGESRDAADQPAARFESRRIGIHQYDGANYERDQTAESEHGVTRYEELGNHHGDAQHHEHETRKIDGQDLQGIQTEQQADCAGHAGQDGTWVIALEHEAVQTDDQQAVGDQRICQHREQRNTPVHFHELDGGAFRLQSAYFAPDPDLASIERCQQVRHVGRDQVD